MDKIMRKGDISLVQLFMMQTTASVSSAESSPCQTPASNTVSLNYQKHRLSTEAASLSSHRSLLSDSVSFFCFLPFSVSLQDAAISSARYLNINTAGALQAHFSFVKYPRYYLLHKRRLPPTNTT